MFGDSSLSQDEQASEAVEGALALAYEFPPNRLLLKYQIEVGLAPGDAPPADAAVWGVGAERSLRAYERLAGVDFGAKRVTPLAERGGLPSERWFWGAALEG